MIHEGKDKDMGEVNVRNRRYIGRCFGVLKARFPILKRMAEY